MHKKWLIQKTFFTFIYFLAMAFSLQGATYLGSWQKFNSLAGLAGADSGFPLIDEGDLGLVEPEVAAGLTQIDLNGDGSISLEEYFRYYKQPEMVVDFLEKVDQSSNAYSRDEYGGMLANLRNTENALGSLREAVDLFLFLRAQHSVSFLASSRLQAYLGNLYSLPRYLQSGFFYDFEVLLTANGSGEPFDAHYRILSAFLLEINSRKQLSGDTASLVVQDINRINGLSAYYTLEDCLQIYENINTLYFSGKKKSSGAFGLLGNIISEGDDLVSDLGDLSKPQDILFAGLDFLVNILDKNSGGLNLQAKRNRIASEWSSITSYMEQTLALNSASKRKMLQEMQILTADPELYLAVQPTLALYLDTFFSLQYETSIPRTRVIFLYTVIEENYPREVTWGVGRSFARHEYFVLAYKDDVLLRCVEIVYSKTGSIFESSFEYFISQTGRGRMALKEMVYIYEKLTVRDLGFLVENSIPLPRLRRIIGMYYSEIDFYLPVFAGVYVAGGAGERSVEVIEESVPFHRDLKRNEITMLKGLWTEEFALNFFLLLEMAVIYPDYLLPLTAELKEALFGFIKTAADFQTQYDAWLRFSFDVYGQQGLADLQLSLLKRLLVYLGREREINTLFTDYYLGVLRELTLAYAIGDVEGYAYLLMDILKANPYNREEVARIFVKNTPHLAIYANLVKIRQISVENEFSPDIFPALERVELSLAEEHMDTLLAFLKAELTDQAAAREVFLYALDSVNTLFALQGFFTPETLDIIYDILISLSPDKRRTLLFTLGQISYFQRTIVSPTSLFIAKGVLRRLDKLESDLFDDFFKSTIPTLDYMIKEGDDLIEVFNALEAGNAHLRDTYSAFRQLSVRRRFFMQILPAYSSWLPAYGDIYPAVAVMISPVNNWQAEAAVYLEGLENIFPEILAVLSESELSLFFNQLEDILMIVSEHAPFLKALAGLVPEFFPEYSLADLGDYLAAVKRREVAIEGGKKYYFGQYSWDTRTRLNRLLDQSLPAKRITYTQLAGKGVYDLTRNWWLCGGRGALQFSFTSTYLNFRHVMVSFEGGYLYNLSASHNEISAGMGFNFPLAAVGLTRTVDLRFALGVGGELTFMQDNFYFASDGGALGCELDVFLELHQKIRIGLAAEYTYRIYSEGLPGHRPGAALEFEVYR